ncbi:hypothetical protein N7448_011295 [Penicillium atrosanguineum]|nr:hypothetical protein N7448_011295 [Penicillium atrosanguineum]
MELRDKNRTLQSLSSPSVPKLEEEVIATVWGWAKHQKSFFTSGIKTDTSSPILDSVCQHLIYNKDVAFQINTIHTRLLVYFLARFVNEKLTDTRDMDQVVKLVVDSGWISPNPGLIDLFKENFLKWLKAGKRFIGLVELLGVGAGVIIFVPLIRASTLESHCPRTGPYAHSIKEKLQDMGVPAAASSRRDGWTGHEVVQTLMEHLFAQSTISFVSCDPATEPPATISPATETRRWLRRPPPSHIHRVNAPRTHSLAAFIVPTPLPPESRPSPD